jgi:autotransporter adhesin
LNQSYKTVWNASSDTFVAVGENAKGRGKKSSGCKTRNVALLAAVATSGGALPVLALSALTVSAAMLPAGAFAAANDSAVPDTPSAAANGVKSMLLSATPVTSYVTVNGMNDGTDKAPVASSQGAIAIGSGAVATVGAGGGIDQIAIGRGAVASASNAIALGKYSTASANNAVALGQGTVANRANTVDVGSRQITSVANGTNAMDAVNLAQLQAMGASVSSGVVTNSVVSYDSASRSAITLKGAIGTKITNLAQGSVSPLSTDAVNGSQLYQTNQNVSNVAGNLANVTSNLANVTSTVNNIVNGGGAGSPFVAFGTATGDTTGGSNPRTDDAPANAAGRGSTAIGRGALVSASGTRGTALGELAEVDGAGGVALGTAVNKDGTVSAPDYVIGGRTYNNVGDALRAVNTGTGGDVSKYVAVSSAAPGAKALGDGGIAVGANAYASGNNAIAIGTGAMARYANSTAIGTNSMTDAPNTVSVGSQGAERSITNVADGTNPTDAATVGQLNALDASVSNTTKYIKVISTAMQAQAAGRDSVAIGGNAFANNYQSVAIGAGARAMGVGAVAIGFGSLASEDYTLAVGNKGMQRRIINVADGRDMSDAATVGQVYNILTGTNSSTVSQLIALQAQVAENAQQTSGVESMLLGAAPVTSDLAQNTSDIAKNAGDIANLDTRVKTVERSMTSLANRISDSIEGLVQQDPTTSDLTVAKDTDGTHVDFTGTAGPRELLGVASGTTDGSAVNVGQLRPLVSALGGGAQINADGSVTAPTYHVQGGTQTSVGDALGSLDNGLTTLQQSLAADNTGLIAQDVTSRTINLGAATDGTLINIAGTAGNRVLTGVAPGAVSVSSADAVNGSQLYAHANSTAVALGGGSTVNSDGTITAPSYNVGGTTVNSVGGALSNLDGRVTQNTNDIASLQTTVGSISGSVANALQYDSSAHNSVTLGGSTTAPPVKLTNLQAGDLSATSTDAVTGAQLWSTNQQVSSLTQAVQNVQTTGSSDIASNTTSGTPAAATGTNSTAIGGGSTASGANSVAIGQGSVADQANTVSVGSSGNERRITNVAPGQTPTDAVNMGQFQSGMTDLARNAYSGTASAIALTMIPEVDANKNLAIGVGTAGYKGYQATAVGLSARVTQNLKVKIGAGISSATTTVGAGAAYQW